jgi:6-pyruvoyl-tetrahydropterin synthase
MKVYLLHPDFTMGEDTQAIDFFNACEKELQTHVDASIIRHEMALNAIRPSTSDIFVFFNRDDQMYSDSISSLLRDIVDVKSPEELRTDLFPIAITRDSRMPPEIIKQVQSFDVTEQLRHRTLNESYISTIAVNLARTIVTRLQPTLSKDRMKLFISHRRLDGEEVAAAFCRELRVRSENAFRDLIDIEVGEDAQEVIEENLRQSDAVILLDTPKTWESEWVDKEIRMALSLNLPIVWVKLGAHDQSNRLKTPPIGNPHFKLEVLDPLEGQIPPELVEDVIHKAFNISREFAKSTFDQMRRLKSLTREVGIQFTELDARRMIYQVSIPRRGFKYHQRPMTHLVQFYGRKPKNDDISGFVPSINRLGFDPHPTLGPYYDASLLLGPIPGQPYSERDGNDCIVDSFDEYIGSIEQLMNGNNPTQSEKKGIIISGAFPDSEPEHQQALTDAVHAFSQMILNRGGTVIFGAHPTFQHLIYDMGKRICPDNYKDIIRLYISKYFVTDPMVDEQGQHATVFATDTVENDRQKSLSLMRKKMIADDRAAALIALGGKTDAHGHSPGVDEEIELAKQAGIPVFIIGSVGGRTAQLAKSYQEAGWENCPNGLSKEENQEVMLSKDFRMIASKIFAHLKI